MLQNSVTVRSVEAECVPSWLIVAVMVSVPTLFFAVTSPAVPVELLMLARVVSEEDQVTTPVRLRVLLSLKWPVAVNCRVLFSSTKECTGAMVMDCSVAEFTVRVSPGLVHVPPHPRLGLLAATWVVPPARVCACPLLVHELFTSHTRATLVLVELQVTELVMSCGGPALKVPVAMNCGVLPRVTEGLPGVTRMEMSMTAVTFNCTEGLAT